jgi:predicted RNase H-like HicB family nuclease
MISMQRYLIIIEQGPANCSAYSPDLPGCIATGATPSEVESNMREAIAFHLEGLRADGQPVPEAHSIAAYVEVAA